MSHRVNQSSVNPVVADGIIYDPGMSRRELFALEMMKVFVALPGAGTGVYDESVRRDARMAVEHADALLEELAKSKEVQP